VSISVLSRKVLWGRAGNACAMSTCRRDLMPRIDEETGEALAGAGVLLGEEAHIRSRRPEGARHDSSHGGVDDYANLILLCPTHHTLIDKDGGDAWPVQRIEELKESHEQWVRSQLSFTDKKLLDLEILMAAEIQRFDTNLFERWPSIYWQLSQAIPSIRESDMQAVADAGKMLLAKDWPAQYVSIRAGSERVRITIRLLLEQIHGEFESREGSSLLSLARPEKRIGRVDAREYAKRSHATELNMATTWWLADALAPPLQ